MKTLNELLEEQIKETDKALENLKEAKSSFESNRQRNRKIFEEAMTVVEKNNEIISGTKAKLDEISNELDKLLKEVEAL